MLWSSDQGKTFVTLLRYFIASLAALNGWLIFSRITLRQSMRLLLVLLVIMLASSAAMYAGVPGFEFYALHDDTVLSTDRAMMLASLYTRLSHPFLGLSNDVAPIFSFLVFAFYGFTVVKRSLRYGCITILALFCLIATGSRAQIALTLVALCIYEVMVRRSATRILGALVFAGILFSIALSSPFFQDIVNLTEFASNVESRLSFSNVTSRLEYIPIATQEIERNWWLGYGGGISGQRAELAYGTHNFLLQLWLYYGVVMGTLGAVFLSMPIFYFYQRAARSTIGEHASLQAALMLGWLVLIAAALTQTFFDAALPRIVLFFFAGIGFAMSQLADDNPVTARDGNMVTADQ